MRDAMLYEIGDKVRIIPHSIEQAAYQGQCGTVADRCFGTYTVLMDEDHHPFYGLMESDLEPFVWPAEALNCCTCDIAISGCTCESGKAELKNERERMRTTP